MSTTPRVTPTLQQIQEELGPDTPVEPYNPRFLRKIPEQQRSRDKIKAIVTAAEKLLSDPNIGLNWINTALIAEKVVLHAGTAHETIGISIGSLYSYFEDDVALLDYVWPQRVTVLIRTDDATTLNDSI